MSQNVKLNAGHGGTVLTPRDRACFWCKRCNIGGIVQSYANHAYVQADCSKGHWDARGEDDAFDIVKLRVEAARGADCPDFEDADPDWESAWKEVLR